VYWITTASVEGVMAARLETPADLLDLAVLAESGTLSGWDQERADAIVLGAQKLVADSAVVIVSPLDADLVEFFDDSATNMAWGWCWRYQRRGADDEFLSGAVCTNWRAYDSASAYKDNCFDIYTQAAFLTLGWAGSTPVGSLSLSVEQATLIGDQTTNNQRKNCLLFASSDQQNVSIIHYARSSNDGLFKVTTPPHNILNWYDEDGELQEITWTPQENAVTEDVWSGDPADGNGYRRACLEPWSPKTWHRSTKTASFVRGHWTVSGKKLSRIPGGINVVYDWYLEAFYRFTGGWPSYTKYVGAKLIRGSDYSHSAATNEYEHLIVSDCPGVAWLVGDKQFATEYSFSGCVETSLDSQWWANCVYEYDVQPVNCTAGLNTSPRDIPVPGKVVVNGTEYDLGDTIRDQVLSVLAAMKTYNWQTGSWYAHAADGYNHRTIVRGVPVPDGVDADAADLLCRWIGAA
jgi:hypothetical protein